MRIRLSIVLIHCSAIACTDTTPNRSSGQPAPLDMSPATVEPATENSPSTPNSDVGGETKTSVVDAGSPDAAAERPACSCYYGNGAYCGQGVIDHASEDGCSAPLANEHPGDVLHCEAGVWSVQAECAKGCVVAPVGQADFCRAETDGYLLPWECGVEFNCTQGLHGDICGSNAGDHVGIQAYSWDFGMPRGTPLLASRAGTVSIAANVVGPGEPCYDGCTQPFNTDAFWQCCNSCINTSNHVSIDHGDGTVATYWHLEEVTVDVGEFVEQGQMIGRTGNSGCSSGPHLHFQVMGDCPTGYCQTIPVEFAEAGTPSCGDRVMSKNACASL